MLNGRTLKVHFYENSSVAKNFPQTLHIDEFKEDTVKKTEFTLKQSPT